MPVHFLLNTHQCGDGFKVVLRDDNQYFVAAVQDGVCIHQFRPVADMANAGNDKLPGGQPLQVGDAFAFQCLIDNFQCYPDSCRTLVGIRTFAGFLFFVFHVDAQQIA